MKYFLLILFYWYSVQVAYAQNWDHILPSRGYVDVAEMDSTLYVHLMYATPDNFMQEAVYDSISKAWLHPDAAKKLLKAQQLLKAEYPDRSLIIYDAARPMSVQRRMWNLVRGTDKTNYVSNPANGGGLHNYGMAVDVSILDEAGVPLPMGTPVDFFGEAAHTNKEDQLLQTGKITRKEYDNRQLLRRVMRNAGFRTILYEWWHFNACTRQEARANYLTIE